MHFAIKSVFVTAVFIGVFSRFAAYAQPAETLTNQSIIQLQRAGLGKDVIKAKVENSQGNFDLSTDALLTLKKAGVADEVITEMFNKRSSKPVQENVVSETHGSKNDCRWNRASIFSTL